MRSFRSSTLGTACLLVCAAVAGCAGSANQVTRAAYVVRADRICRSADTVAARQLKAFGRDLLRKPIVGPQQTLAVSLADGQTLRQIEQAAHLERELLNVQTTELARLRGLSRPAAERVGLARAWHARDLMLKDLAYREELRSLRAKAHIHDGPLTRSGVLGQRLRPSYATVTDRYARLAERFGLKACVPPADR